MQHHWIKQSFFIFIFTNHIFGELYRMHSYMKTRLKQLNTVWICMHSSSNHKMLCLILSITPRSIFVLEFCLNVLSAGDVLGRNMTSCIHFNSVLLTKCNHSSTLFGCKLFAQAALSLLCLGVYIMFFFNIHD